MQSYFVMIAGTEHTVSLGPDGQWSIDGENVAASVSCVGESLFSVLAGGSSFKILVTPMNGGFQAVCRGREYSVVVESERTRLLNSFASGSAIDHVRSEITAPMPALVVRIEVSPGDQVKEGQGLIVLEAMKMENELRSPRAGYVKRVLAEIGKAVEKGELLIVLE